MLAIETRRIGRQCVMASSAKARAASSQIGMKKEVASHSQMTKCGKGNRYNGNANRAYFHLWKHLHLACDYAKWSPIVKMMGLTVACSSRHYVTDITG